MRRFVQIILSIAIFLLSVAFFVEQGALDEGREINDMAKVFAIDVYTYKEWKYVATTALFCSAFLLFLISFADSTSVLKEEIDSLNVALQDQVESTKLLVNQEGADRELVTLATSFAEACVMEGEVKARSCGEQTLSKDSAVALAHAQGNVNRSRMAFWRVHRALGRAGFGIHNNLREYLPKA